MLLFQVDVTDAPHTERSGSVETAPTKLDDENDVVVVGGSFFKLLGFLVYFLRVYRRVDVIDDCTM